jgi:hypothetical protein
MDGRMPASSTIAPEAASTRASVRSRASSSIAAWTPPQATNSCGGSTARISTVPPVRAARRAA